MKLSRLFLISSTLALVALVFSACSESDEASSAMDHPGPRVLSLITWEDYVAPEVVAAFTERTGIEVEISSMENTEELFAILRADPNRYDVVIIGNCSVERFQKSRLLQAIDPGKLGGLGNLDPRFNGTQCDPDNRYSVPYHWGSTLVAYRSDKIAEPEPSFELLFDESVKGHVLMLDDMFESLAVPFLIDGRSINDFSEANFRTAASRLKAATRTNGIRFVSDKKVRDGLASGDTWAALCYSGDAAMVAEDCPEVAYFIPREGAQLWMDVMTISREAENVDEAYAFIDFMLQPEIAAMSANSLWCASPNRLAEPLLDEALSCDTALIPGPEQLDQCEFFSSIPQEFNSVISKLAREIQHERPDPLHPASLAQ